MRLSAPDLRMVVCPQLYDLRRRLAGAGYQQRLCRPVCTGAVPPLHCPLLRTGTGYTILSMLTGHWMFDVLRSFVGVFGQFQYWVDSWIIVLYYILFTAGLIGCLMQAGKMFRIRKDGEIQKKAVFNWGMLIAALTPVILNFYHSYWVDYQPQDAICCPGLCP